MSYLCAYLKYSARAILYNANTKGNNTYNSCIIAHPSANIQNLDDLKGKTIALGDPGSTSSRLIPLYALKKANFDLKKDIKPVYVEGNVLDLVQREKYPAGATSSDDYYGALERNEFQKGDLVLVKEIIEYPIHQGPFVVRNDIQHYDELRIEDAFLTVAEKDSGILSRMKIGGFAKTEYKNYEPLLNMAKEVDIDVESLG